MEIRYNVTGERRKALVKAISDTTGARAVYKFMPTCSYEVDYFTVTKDGTLLFDDRADSEEVEKVLDAIAAAGFECEPAADFEEAAPGGETAATEAETDAPAAEPEEPAQEAEEGATAPNGAEDGEQAGLTVSLPMAGHTGASLRNLVAMVFSRGKLLSKATGGHFSCTEELVDALRDDASILTAEKLASTITEFEAENGKALTGLSFEADKVSFTGFPYTEDAEKVQTFQQLACQMNKLAKEQKRTLAREVDDSNERYILRIWLLRLGMAGDDFKTARRVLLAPLSGSSAFKDNAMAERWQTKQKAKRDAARVAASAEPAADTAADSVENAEEVLA